jgi:hypothetical protein
MDLRPILSQDWKGIVYWEQYIIEIASRTEFMGNEYLVLQIDFGSYILRQREGYCSATNEITGARHTAILVECILFQCR